MNNPLENLKNEALKIGLTSAEKSAMRARVMEYAKKGMGGAVPTPYFSYFRQYSLSLAALLIVVFGGTAYASQNALPGSPLYAIKTNVTEPAQGALAFSEEAKAQYHADLAETRLEEAEVLASKGELDASTSAQIESGLNTQIAQVNLATQSLASQDQDAATETTTQFDASLSAHSAILSRLGGDSSNEQTKENSGTLATIAGSGAAGPHARTFGAAAVPMMAKAVVASAPTPASHAAPMMHATALSVSEIVSTSTAAATEQVQNTSTTTITNKNWHDRGNRGQSKSDSNQDSRAAKAFANVQSQFNSIKASLDATTSAQVQARLDAIQAALTGGDAIGALSQSTRLSAFISANQQFDNGILKNLLDQDGESEYGDQ